MEFMSQYDSKIVYIKCEDNCVTDMISHFPVTKSIIEAECTACHPYNFCSDDESNEFVASIWSTKIHSLLDSVTALAKQMSCLHAVFLLAKYET
jgi:hypothetical protein